MLVVMSWIGGTSSRNLLLSIRQIECGQASQSREEKYKNLNTCRTLPEQVKNHQRGTGNTEKGSIAHKGKCLRQFKATSAE